MPSSSRKVTLLGATGSIGRSTLDVISQHPDAYELYAVTAHRSRESLLDICLRFAPARAVIGKSWEGVYGGWVAVAILVFIYAAWLSLDSRQTLALLAVALVVAFISVIGDLLESMLKRFRGLKDSSRLLPGHGGILDRIDSLTAAVPLFALILPWLG